jgi:hypothetical protein
MTCTCKGDNRSGTAQLCELCARDRETLPPTSAPDHQAADFEQLVRERGESRARWDHVMALLAEREEGRAA